MLAGTYSITLKTPVGAKKGELILKTDGSGLTGAIVVKGTESPIEAGTVNGSAFTFRGTLDTALGKMAYNAAGHVDGDAITGEAKTKKGTMKLSGKRK